MMFLKAGEASVGVAMMVKIHHYYMKMAFNFPDKKARFALNDWVRSVEFEAQYDCH